MHAAVAHDMSLLLAGGIIALALRAALDFTDRKTWIRVRRVTWRQLRDDNVAMRQLLNMHRIRRDEPVRINAVPARRRSA